MPRYSDPSRCPDCRTTLPPYPLSCPVCALPLQDPLAADLLGTLRHADELLVRLRASAPSPAATVGPAPIPTPMPVPAPGAPLADAPRRRGLGVTSVPKVLLGLGALCLLVAAVTFLAVAWAWLGIGGRTTVLVTLTGVTGGLGSWLARRGLRLAGESLTVVALGLLVLDVLGAASAGWLGDLSFAGTTIAVGAVLGGTALALLAAPAPGGHALAAPQLAAVLGTSVVAAGLTGLAGPLGDTQVVAAGTAVALLALVATGRRAGTPVLVVAAAVGGGLWWTLLTLTALDDATSHAGIRAMWLAGHGGPGLLAASVLLLAPLALLLARLNPAPAPGAAAASPTSETRTLLGRACVSGSATLATLTVALPATDESATVLSLTALALLALWTTVAVTAPGRWSTIARAPMALTATPVLVVAALLLGDAALRVLVVGAPLSRTAGVRLDGAADVAHPAVLLPAVLGLLAALVAARPRAEPPTWALGAAAALAGAGTLALLPVPLWTVVAALALVATGLLAAGLRRTERGGAALLAGGVLAVTASLAALPSDVVAAAAAALLTLGAGATVLLGRAPGARVAAGAVLPLSAAWLAWSAAEVTGLDPAYRGLVVLLAVGLAAVARPRLEVEAGAGTAALLASVAAVAAATDRSGSLALHLTVAGVLVCTSGLLSPARRHLGWVGGLLLAAATWVRLADLGVQAPEAYTLPGAAVLLLVGLRRLQLDPRASTAVTLTPALTLATVPSLLWVLAEDPVSPRAVLLGLGCLALLLGGTRLHWSAPLVVGGTVGALLVLRELAPWAAVTPQWVLIGLAGTLLTVVGVTWERRLRDLQHAASYLGRLR